MGRLCIVDTHSLDIWRLPYEAMERFLRFRWFILIFARDLCLTFKLFLLRVTVHQFLRTPFLSHLFPFPASLLVCLKPHFSFPYRRTSKVLSSP